MAKKGYDFAGWATKYNIKCSDGRTILPGAFDGQDMEIPLCDSHKHGGLENVIGHATLEHRPEGLYAYGYLNTDTKGGKHAKALLAHKDIRALSIWANGLRQSGGNVSHADIKELSLVMSGANRGAKIEFFPDPAIAHSAFVDLEDLADEDFIEMSAKFDDAIDDFGEEEDAPEDDTTSEPENVHSDNEENDEDSEEEPEGEEDMPNIEHTELRDDMTVKEAYEALDPKTKNLVDYIVGMVAGGNGEDADMAHGGFNIFEGEDTMGGEFLSHDELCSYMEEVANDLKRGGMLKDAMIAHAADYGIDNIDILFPEAAYEGDGRPDWINRDAEWVEAVLSAVYKFPTARVKMEYADITEDEARARGYIKGKLKKNEVFSLLKRAISPTWIYKKQKLDRQDMIDVGKRFDIIPWLKAEMRIKLNEELARAILFGDGRLTSSDDKVDETKIIPVINDHDFYVLRYAISETVGTDAFAEAFADASIAATDGYRGSSNCVAFIGNKTLLRIRLLKDKDGNRRYKTMAEICDLLGVKEIFTVPYLDEGVKDKDGKDIYGVILNMNDYGVGTDKGGEINTFDNFNIDYNQYHYLMETYCSGALRKPFSAIVIRKGAVTGSEAAGLTATLKAFKEGNVDEDAQG